MGLNQERLDEVNKFNLKVGSGSSIENACVMEMVAYIAGEPWSDHPVCACPILTTYAIRLNDAFNDEHRQKLKPFIPMLVDTKIDDAVQIKRKQLIMWRNVTATYPILLDNIKLNEISEKLRSFPNSVDGMAEVEKVLSDNWELIRKANAFVNAFVNAYAFADANAFVNSFADADAYADDNAYAFADADAYTLKQLRDKLAETSIETMGLAIQITGDKK